MQGEGSRFTLWLVVPAAAAPVTARDRGPLAAVPLAQRDRQGQSNGASLVDVGRVLLEDLNAITARFVAAVRADSTTLPNVDRLTDVQLQNHLRTWLADIAQALIILQSTPDDPSELMRDTTEIQRVVSERHGVQRQRLAWTETALSREFQLLRQVIDEVLDARRETRASGYARSVLEGFIEQAEHTSLRALRNALRTSSSASAPL